MALFRSGSQKSTLSIVQSRVTKYQKFLNLSNVFLLITSTILIFTAIVLMKFYHVTKLDFWHALFAIVPPYIIVLGFYTFGVCFFGFAISGSERRALLAVYAVLLAIAFVAQIGSIFMSLELRSVIEQEKVTAANVNDDLMLYGVDHSITAKWDELQRYYHCCGANNFLTGYNDYRSTPIGRNFSVPDSCCHQQTTDCGYGIFKQSEDQIINKIFVNGCLTLLQYQLETDVVPMMVGYAVVGVILALVELITVVLASAYVAQITRRERRANRSYAINDRHKEAAEALRGETDI
jgi:hypothetical protein